MPISAISNVTAQPVTSDNQTVLEQQELTVQNEISQAQKNHASSKNIQDLKQELQSIQQALRKVSSNSAVSSETKKDTSDSHLLNVKA